jgi:hypothetical protein
LSILIGFDQQAPLGSIFYFNTMNIKISNWAIFAILVGVGILIFALFRGCQAAKNSKDNISSLKASNDSLKTLNKETKEQWALSDKAHADSLEFERGQRTLAENQYERTSLELDKERAINKKLIEKYKYHQYADTGMVMTPSEFVNDCKDCFTQLERTDNLTFKLRKEVTDWNNKYNKETKRLEDRLIQIKEERDGYYNKVDSLTKIQSKSIAQIKPTGRLYFSWGVLWSPLPIAAGGGIMYQTPRNIIFGLKGYYGVTKSMSNKTTIETTINFPLSFKIK